MRRVKLYEAFRSNILSKITDYLKKSGISDREKSNFLNDMNSILGSFKIPIDKIENLIKQNLPNYIKINEITV